MSRPRRATPASGPGHGVRHRRRASSPALLVLATACSGASDTVSCGSRVLIHEGHSMGAYALQAEPTLRACELPEVSDGGFTFAAHLGRNERDGGAIVIVNPERAERLVPARWDGRRFGWTESARRLFPARCGDCQTMVEEDVVLTLLSRAQHEALGTDCPRAPADGGELAVDGLDPPRWTPLGFDAVRACGTLVFQVREAQGLDGGDCPWECSRCRVEYGLRGDRT